MLSSSRKNIDSRPNRPSLPRRAAPGALGALAGLFGVLCCGPAAAAVSDTVHPFVAVVYTHDDNLLRRGDEPSGADPRGDNLKQVQAGLLFERPIGRQILTGQAKVSKVTFDHYDQFNYNGKDFLAALEWHVANHLEGHLGASYNQTLTPFADSQETERNLRVQHRAYFDGGWRFHPSWRVRGGVSRDRTSYDLSSQRFNERTELATEAGLDYLAASGSRVGLQLRKVKGTYPNRRTVGSLLVDNDYDQNEIKANVYWNYSGATQFQLLGGWVERKHAFFTLRDATGVNGRAIAYWAPTGKLRFTATGWREFGVVESALVNNSLNKGASLAAVYAASAKTSVNASLRRERRDFSGLNGVVLPDDSSDSTRSSSLGLSYQPHRVLTLGASLSHDVRGGSAIIGSGGYSANVVSFNASAQF
ncbi:MULTISPECIES: XrtB/PEP-CTERM-associated polysaccharide biosynthesis outer membrane protein EpsL [unclassified Janthinobacterium]|uniref:XrtB/PEP-CTERM-associated polysaccharide biosynthesis outer membrane protein EpsL n=1 Tax=unclassified Janthinobacterium TaxID=2610881 RepID=UPI000370640D|nr:MULTISPECIES: XrtB/PEP-CTERM-associated polysaccharide biosynthesis outer membrane protein EpsL [unclassified Janthinobacterium]MEC5163517.1 exopolysaccharide biosynthesis operon protein EpsL [Janthinobacterium sp. CG_S6]